MKDKKLAEGTTQLSGLSDFELMLDKLITTIKLDNYTLSCIGTLRKAMEQYAQQTFEGRLRELIDGHDIKMLLKKCKQLKQSDGEGWAIGNFVENILNEYSKINQS